MGYLMSNSLCRNIKEKKSESIQGISFAVVVVVSPASLSKSSQQPLSNLILFGMIMLCTAKNLLMQNTGY